MGGKDGWVDTDWKLPAWIQQEQEHNLLNFAHLRRRDGLLHTNLGGCWDMGFWMGIWLIRAKNKGKIKQKKRKRKERQRRKRKRQIYRLHLSILFSPQRRREQQQQKKNRKKKKEKEKQKRKRKTNLSPIIQKRNPRPRHTPSLIKSRRQFRINF